MDHAERLQFKISVYIQFAVTITYSCLNIFHLFNKIFFVKEVDSTALIFLFFNVLLFLSFYILIKSHKIAGSHLFFTVLALVLLANIFLNKYQYINIQTIYIIPIFLTLILYDRKFTIFYSLIIVIIFITDQIVNNQLYSINSITIFITVILNIIIILIYDKWIKEINSLRLDSITENYTSTLRLLYRVTELKDDETHEHLKRVSIIVEMIAKKLKKNPHYSHYLSDFYIEDLKAASALHDIGKIGIDDRILQKNGKLTPEEYEMIKNHTTYGANFLDEAKFKTGNNLYSLAIDLAKHHHEKWDGTGYPDKLKGKNIPLSARIMAIADVYDALVSKRSYKRAYSDKEAYIIIVSEAGYQFDPDIVSCFTKIHKKIYEQIKHLL